MAVIQSFIPDYLSSQDAQALTTWLQNSDRVNWEIEAFSIFGRSIRVPRQTAWFGDPGVVYRYTGLDHAGLGWPVEMCTLRDDLFEMAGLNFNFVILNRYRSGTDYMGWHTDAERGAEPQIASLSVGAKRTFKVRQDPDETVSYDLGDGGLLMFDGRNRHQLPRRAGQNGERINMTFRRINPGISH
jgi:alkylated DNA repair dioxygenase AlkB